jgi:hypothetical protein
MHTHTHKHTHTHTHTHNPCEHFQDKVDEEIGRGQHYAQQAISGALFSMLHFCEDMDMNDEGGDDDETDGE